MRLRVLSLFAACLVSSACSLHAQSTETSSRPLPRIVHQGTRYAFMLDGKPYFILGAQIHNSSSWPVMLPKTMKLAEDLHANTIEAPVSGRPWSRSRERMTSPMWMY